MTPALLVLAASMAAADVPAVVGAPAAPEERLADDVMTRATPPPLDPALDYPPSLPQVHARSEWLQARWGCRHLGPDDVADKDVDDDTRPRERIAVHHTEIFVAQGERAMGPARSADAVKSLLCGIRNFHMSPNNNEGEAWSDIGYHFLIDWRGRVWRGRPIEKQGANVKNMNPGTIGVALMGDFDRQRPFPEQLAALKRLSAYLVYQYKIPPLNIHGHHEYVRTDCPGRYLERPREQAEPYVEKKATPLRRMRIALLSLWRRMAGDGLLAAAPPPVPPTGPAPARPDATGVRLTPPPSLVLPRFDGR